jgi:regulator of sirC expression with transglutaminase-like and TPR domain
MMTLSTSPLHEIGACDDDALDLIDAALLLALQDMPKADVHAAHSHVDDMTGDALTFAGRSTNARERAQALADAVHGRHGYSGDRRSYDDPENANLLSVIRRRRGLPVALAILYMGIARRLGWDVQGLNVPAHFLLRVGDETDFVLQDPFEDGSLISPHDVPAKLATLGVPEEKASSGLLTVLPARAILVRLLNNQAARAEAAGQMERALELHERMTLIAPQFTGLWWERARLERDMGRLSAARASLTNLMETTRDPRLLASVRQATAHLARHLN